MVARFATVARVARVADVQTLSFFLKIHIIFKDK